MVSFFCLFYKATWQYAEAGLGRGSVRTAHVTGMLAGSGCGTIRGVGRDRLFAAEWMHRL